MPVDAYLSAPLPLDGYLPGAGWVPLPSQRPPDGYLPGASWVPPGTPNYLNLSGSLKNLSFSGWN
eukprot:8680563-Pyramimonas_sp.AAC.1